MLQTLKHEATSCVVSFSRLSGCPYFALGFNSPKTCLQNKSQLPKIPVPSLMKVAPPLKRRKKMTPHTDLYLNQGLNSRQKENNNEILQRFLSGCYEPTQPIWPLSFWDPPRFFLQIFRRTKPNRVTALDSKRKLHQTMAQLCNTENSELCQPGTSTMVVTKKRIIAIQTAVGLPFKSTHNTIFNKCSNT